MADDQKTLEQLQAEKQALDELLKADEKRLAMAQKIRKEEEANLRLIEQRKAKAEAFALKDQQLRQTTLKQHQEELAELEKKNVSLFNFEKRMEHLEEIKNRELEIGQMTIAHQEKELQELIKAGTVSEEILEQKRETLEKNKKMNKTQQQALKDGREAVQQGGALLKNITSQALGQSKLGSAIAGSTKGMYSLVKGAWNLKKAVDAGAISMSMLTAATGVGIILLVVAAIAKLVEWVFTLAVKTRDATVAFQRATGATQEFGAAIPALERDMRAVGVSMDEASAAQMALYTSTTDYTMASAAARKDLLKTTALMGEFGVSVETSAKIAQAATKGLGMGIGEADELLLGLSAHAQDIGVPINKMMDDFAASADELKRFGSDGERVFKRLAMVSKVTGMEISRILAITEKFDTFEGAAKQAGMLNAAIGGNMVNAMDLMMTTDPVERFTMIKDSIMDTVGSFDDMSYYQKKFYANAAGLKDVGELAAMMSGDFTQLEGGLNKSSKEFAEQRKQAQKWQDTMGILKNTLAALAPTFEKLTPLINKMLEEFMAGEGPLKDIGNIFEEFMSEEVLIPFLKEMPAMIKSVVDGLKDFAKNVEGIVTGLKIAGTLLGMVLLGLALAASPLVLSFKLIVGIVLGVTAAIKGLIWWFKKKNSPSFLDLFTGGVLEKGMKGVASAIKLLAKPFKALGGIVKRFGEMFRETFSFENIKKKVIEFVKWIPGEWAEGVMGIKTEMEISSPSKKMEREIMDPTFVQPMKSVAAKMPGLVDEVYGDVPAMAAKNLKPLTGAGGAPAAMNMDQMAGELAKGNITKVMAEITNQNKAALAALTQGNAGAGPQTTQVSIPITIGKEQLGTVVTEIVDGRLGAVSWQGLASTGI